MAGGFANTNPLDALRTLNDIDNSRYQREVDYGTRRAAWLDQQAEVAQNAAYQLKSAAQEFGKSRAVADLGITDPAQLEDPGVKARVEAHLQANSDKYMDEFAVQNKDMIEKSFGDLAKNNPHIKQAWNERLGEHREFVGIRQGKAKTPRMDPETKQPMLDPATGKMILDEQPSERFGIVVKNAKTGTTGFLDSTPDGEAGSTKSVSMTGSELINNLIGLGEGAALSRGQVSQRALEAAGSSSDEAFNAGVENQRQAGLRQNEAAAGGQARLARTGAELNMMTDASSGGGGQVTGGGFSGGGVPQPEPAAQDAAVPPATPPTSALPAGGETSSHSHKAPLPTLGTKRSKAEREEAWLQIGGAVEQANTQPSTRGLISGELDSLQKIDQYLDENGWKADDLKGKLHPKLLSELRQMRIEKEKNASAAAAPAGLAAPVHAGVDDFDAAAAAAGMSRAQYMTTPEGSDKWKTITKKFEESDILAVNNAIVNGAADARKLSALSPRQRTALTLMQRMGVPGYTPEDIQLRQQGRMKATDKFVTDLTAENMAASIPQTDSSGARVDTTLAQTKLRERGEMQRTAAMIAAKGGEDAAETYKNLSIQLDRIAEAQFPEDKQAASQFRAMTVRTLPYLLNRGVRFASPMEQELAMQNVADFYQKYSRGGKGGVFGFFKDDPNFSGANAEMLFEAANPPELWRGSGAYATGAAEFANAARTGKLTENEAAMVQGGDLESAHVAYIKRRADEKFRAKAESMGIPLD